MGPKENASEQQAQALKTCADKKPYARPALRRLGTVRELTHGHPSKAVK